MQILLIHVSYVSPQWISTLITIPFMSVPLPTVIAKGCVAVALNASVTLAVKLYVVVTVAVGVPLTNPVEFSVSPDPDNEPAEIPHVYGVVPPVATNCLE